MGKPLPIWNDDFDVFDREEGYVENIRKVVRNSVKQEFCNDVIKWSRQSEEKPEFLAAADPADLEAPRLTEMTSKHRFFQVINRKPLILGGFWVSNPDKPWEAGYWKYTIRFLDHQWKIQQKKGEGAYEDLYINWSKDPDVVPQEEWRSMTNKNYTRGNLKVIYFSFVRWATSSKFTEFFGPRFQWHDVVECSVEEKKKNPSDNPSYFVLTFVDYRIYFRELDPFTGIFEKGGKICGVGDPEAYFFQVDKWQSILQIFQTDCWPGEGVKKKGKKPNSTETQNFFDTFGEKQSDLKFMLRHLRYDTSKWEWKLDLFYVIEWRKYLSLGERKRDETRDERRKLLTTVQGFLEGSKANKCLKSMQDAAKKLVHMISGVAKLRIMGARNTTNFGIYYPRSPFLEEHMG